MEDYAHVRVDQRLESECFWEQLYALRHQTYDEWRDHLDLAVLRQHDRILRATVREYLDASPEALADLERIEDLFTDRARHTISLAILMEDWSNFVIRVEEGYDLGQDDYANDLDGRELIHQIMAVVPSIRDKVVQVVAPWDARFQQATVVSLEPRGGGSAGAGRDLPGRPEGRRWWYWREPKRWPGLEDR